MTHLRPSIAFVALSALLCPLLFTLSGCSSSNAASTPTPTPTPTAPAATLSATSLSFPSATVGVTTASQTVTLTNGGTAALTISSISLGGTDTALFALVNGCGSTLAISASCTLSVVFRPTDLASRSASITVTTNATPATQTVALSGQAVAPTATLSATALTFSNATIGVATATQSITLTNSGTGVLTLTTLSGGTDLSFFTTSTTCGATLAAGSSCTISASYKATDTNKRTATILLSTNAAPANQTITLSGLATAPLATLSATALTFGAVVGITSASQPVTLTNSGTAVLNITSITLGGTDAAFFTATNGCGTTLAVGASCTFSAVFKPTDTTTRVAAFTITTNAASSPQTVALSGTGTPAPMPTATLSPASLTFANAGIAVTTAAQSVTLSNNGSAVLNITSITLGGTDAAFFTLTNSCGVTLAINASCTFSVAFKATDFATRAAAVTVLTNATPASQTVPVSGVGIPDKCSTATATGAFPQPGGSIPALYTGAAFSGKVKACSLPVIGASVQLYAAGTTGNGSTPTALGAPITTDATGSFSVPAGYSCPADTSLLYLVSRGGIAGHGAVNAGTVLMTALGSCKSITGTPSFLIDEATTVASAYALGQLLSTGGNVGASATNINGPLLAAAGQANLVNVSTGLAPGVSFPSTGTPPTLNLNALANALNACIVSVGASSAPCTQLYAATTVGATAPSNTLDAILNLARHPAVNVATLFTLTSGATYYAPSATTAPSDWTLFVTYTGAGMHAPSGLGIDSAGNIAVANYFAVASFFTNTGAPIAANGISGDNLDNSYGLAISSTDAVWIPNEQSPGSINGGIGTVSVFSGITAAPTAVNYSAGGLNYPVAIAFDTSQIAWVVDYGNSHITLLNSSGTPISGATGYTSPDVAFPVAVAINSKKMGFIANQSTNTITRFAQDGTGATSFVTGTGASGLAVDASDNVWVANYYGNSVGLLSASGTIVSSGLVGGGVNHPQGIAIDGAGNAWVANYRGPALSEFAAANASNAGAALSPAIGYGQDAQLLEAFAIAIDAAGNIWVTNFGNNTLTEFIGLAAPVKTPLIGPVALP